MGLNFARTTTYRKLDHDSMVAVMEIDPDADINEGTPCYFDAADGLVKPIPAKSGTAATDDAIAEKYVGIAQGTNPVAHHMPRTRKSNKMSFYIGDAIVKMFFHAGNAIDKFTDVFAGDEVGVGEVAVASRTESLGKVFIDVEEFKVAHTTTEGEEVSVLMRPSIFKTRSFA